MEFQRTCYIAGEIDCSCREAVAHILAEQVACGQHVTHLAGAQRLLSGTTTITAVIVQIGIATGRPKASSESRLGVFMPGRRLRIVDGSTCLVPDTPSRQQNFGGAGWTKTGLWIRCCYPAELLQKGCDGVFRLHGARSRTVDFRPTQALRQK